MTTPFSNVYAYFLPKVSDYSFLNIDQTQLEDQLETLLNSSIVKFKKCRNNLYDKDSVNKWFNSNLTEEEMEILGTLMVVEYLSPKLLTSDLLNQNFSTRDYSTYSQANQIDSIRNLRDLYKKEAQQLMVSYSYDRKLDDML